MSDANRTKVSFVEEAVLGVLPANPAWTPLRVKSADLKYTQQKIQSEELRSDRQVPDLILVGADAEGGTPVEVSYGSFDELLQGMLFSTWTNAPYRYNTAADSPITDVSATDITVTAAAGNPSGMGAFAAGHLIRTTGFGVAGNNGLFVLTAGSGVIATAAGLAVEAAVPAGARVKVVGMRGAAGDLTFTAGATNSIDVGAGVVDFVACGVLPGMWLKVSGGTGAAAANNDWVRVVTVAASQLVLDRVPVGWVTDAAAGMTITLWMGDVLRNGVTKRSYSLESQFQDLTNPEFHYFSGMVPSTLELGFQSKAILQASLAFMGTTAAAPATVRFAGSTDKTEDYYTAALPTVSEVMNATANVGRIAMNGAVITGPNYVTSATINVNNQLRRREAVGSLGSVDIAAGRAMVTGKLSLYYGDKTVLDQIRNNAATSFETRVVDPNGTRALLVDLPRVKLGAGDPTVPGVDTDRMLEPEFTAVADPTLGYTIQLQRVEEFV